MPDTMSSTQIAGQAGNDVIPDLIGDLSPK